MIADKVKSKLKERKLSKKEQEADEKSQGFKKVEPLKNRVQKEVGTIGNKPSGSY